MSNLKNINPDNDDEIEPPTDGPPPDWMKTATSSAGSSFKENDAPQWLRNIRAGKGTPAESGAKATPRGEPEASADDTMSDLERLLAAEGIDLTGVSDERPEGAEGMSVKDWMIATSDDEIIRRKVGAEPLEKAAAPQEEPELSPEAPAPAAASAADVVEDELPDWLREISDEVETSPPLAAPAVGRPAAAKPVEEKEALPGDEDLPDWLREVSEQVQEVTPPVVSDAGPVAGQDDMMLGEEGLPDWLQGISDEPAPAAEPLGEFDLEAELEAGEVDEAMPGWLQEVEEEDDDDETLVLPATSADKLVVTDELPSWLREVEEDQAELSVITPEPEPIRPEQPLEAEAEILEDELPDWLREDQVSVPDTDLGPEFEPAPYPMTDSSDTAIDEENLPDWLRDVQEAGVETEGELPRLTIAEAAVLGEEELEEEEHEEIQETELPDWLKEVQAEEEIITPTAPPPVAVAPTPVPPAPATEAQVVEEELPDWLREAAEESAEAGFELEPIREAVAAEAKEELPAWLQGVEGEEEPFEPSEPSPDEFGFGAGEEEVEPALVQEELPGWLKEVQEQSEELVVLEEITTPGVEEVVVVETALPGWLEVEAEAEAVPVPTEPEPVIVEVAAPEIEAAAEPEPEAVEPLPVELPAPVVVEEVAAPIADASLGDMPDWLKKLREGDVEEEQIAVPAIKPLPKPAVARPMVSAVVAPEPESLAEVAVSAEAIKGLEQARVARDAGNIDAALQHYENLISGGLQLDRIIEDIKQIIKSYPANAMLYQVMGDAMMKDGRLLSALDAYRTALAKL